MEQVIFLVGMMGSGKSYWGKRLSEACGCPFVDLDQSIERGEGASISRLFEYRGEAVFRALEGSYLRTLLDKEGPLVVSTGGGTPCFFDNMAFMNRHGRTIWLDIPPAVLEQRLLADGLGRPLLSGVGEGQLVSFLENKLVERSFWYRQSDVRLCWEAYEEEGAFWEALLLAVGWRVAKQW
jgi:shikimate kinase